MSNTQTETSEFVQALTIAGSDSGGGAGIQADLKTFQMRGVFGASVLTAVTAQNTQGVSAIHLLPADIIRAQIEAVRADFHIRAFKIGMLGTADIIECVADSLQNCRFGRLVLDPVMIAKGGVPLLQDSAVEAMKRRLLPLDEVLTPNLPEAYALTGVEISDGQSAARAAKILQDAGVKNVLIKGGHLNGSGSRSCTDRLFAENGEMLELNAERYPTRHTHGTGCTISACLTAELAKGFSIKEAVGTAKNFITAAISNPLEIGAGHGPVNHWAYRD
ncbi:bifunctional hydroxymethylpyrimidine kinase/phosphomethylpyrimidine kinase [Neisseria chenwenguii]|uniref:hydroxymethylpyrimidine kinase n=1 Tax=Neisseria chenwenguii TaxID=1853278 RepID=A0A220S030_9NEIS|nr:bifunctional hydroxymethylpyrimidine kinase/phosphomethylpyrimidine kinase [Neisseria chenwenguii]ASK26797.1 bifunctional hydroxymethylpyrimidine kinase/phosphomethylpyrimidine kinase [Neisseria chenwenguii]ROV56774.1 bifunctional hydroxymethylpyrimidine kinase/phosphomethylpyrimidine kinase [Neisseria chenwenguii]